MAQHFDKTEVEDIQHMFDEIMKALTPAKKRQLLGYCFQVAQFLEHIAEITPDNKEASK